MSVTMKHLKTLLSRVAMHVQCTPIHHLLEGGGGRGQEMLSEFRPVIAFGDCTISVTLLQLFFCTALPVIMPTSSALMGVCRTLYHSSLLNILRAQHLIAELRPVSASVDCTPMATLLLHRCSSHHAHQLHKHTWCSNRYYASPIRFLQSQQSSLRTGSSVRFITSTMPWGAVHASSLHGG